MLYLWDRKRTRSWGASLVYLTLFLGVPLGVEIGRVLEGASLVYLTKFLGVPFGVEKGRTHEGPSLVYSTLFFNAIPLG